MPNLLVLAGPNGAGKSTSAPEILTGFRQVDEFVNADVDVIARDQGLSDVAAGRQVFACWIMRSGTTSCPDT
jgi:predicted ABC-type ATPase